MNPILQNLLQIRYVKLHFNIVFTENTILPKYKASALRGGMGEMLIQANCIRDRNCEMCEFESECIVRRTMYSKFAQKPKFVTTGESVGYVLECENYTEFFRSGESMDFNLILFGNTIVYFNLYMRALYALGMQGIGKNCSHFQIVSVTNSKKNILFKNNNIDMQQYKVMTVTDYVIYRMKSRKRKNKVHELSLKTPLTVKYQGKILQEVNAEAMIKAVIRRIYMLDCFEGIENSPYDFEFEHLPIPKLASQDVHHIAVPRYSSVQDKKMVLHGIEGSVKLYDVKEDILALLYAGELIHIGKNTSFGFGRYRLK